MKTIIAPPYLHPILRTEMMTSEKTNYLVNWRFLTLDQLLKLDNEPTNLEIEAFNCLKTLTLGIFKPMIEYPTFIKSCLNTLRLLYQYQISFDELPQYNAEQEELFIILNALKSLPLKQSKIQLKLAALSSLDLSNTYLYPDFLDPFKMMIYDLLIQNGAKYYELQQIQPELTLSKALNPRIEIEAIAQSIIQKKLDPTTIQLIVTDHSYFELIRLVFSRYKLPYIFAKKTYKQSILAKHFVSLYLFSKQPDLESLKQLITQDAFHLDSSSDYLAYINYCVSDFDTLLSPFNYYKALTPSDFAKDFITDALELEIKACSYQEKFNPFLTELLSATDDLNRITIIFELLKRHPQQDELYLIKAYLEAHITLLNPHTEALFLQGLQAVSVGLKQEFTAGILVSTIKHPVPCCKVRYIVGLDQKSYPGFSSYTGYFDEHYFESTSLMSEEKRYALYLDNLKWLFHHSNELHLSYCYADFSGKSKELSYHIESIISGKAQMMHCVQNDLNTKTKPQLTTETSEQIYLVDNQLSTTVYKMEMYFSCPYRHYLNHALKLRVPNDLYFFPKIHGLINHSIIETLIHKKQKQYPDTSITTITELLTPFYEDLKRLFPNKSLELNLFYRQNIELLKLNLFFLNHFEKSSAYCPYKLEEKFEHHFDMNKFKLRIAGIIDRIDQYEDKFRIVDYKSSTHTLNLEDILSGLKLQLATYLYCLYLKDTKQIPTALLYYGFNQTNTSYTTYIKNKDGFIKEDESSLEIKYFKKNRFNGLLFNDQEAQGDPNYITSKTMDYDFKDLFRDLNTIYGQYTDGILKGNIAIDPVKKACLYCDYKMICRFMGVGKEPKSLVEIDEVTNEVE